MTNELKPTGDCYEAAYNLFSERSIEMDDDDYRLVHGTAIGQGPIEGVPHGHAWVEVSMSTVMTDAPFAQAWQHDWMVLDYSNGKQLQMPRGLYYTIGRIEHARRYSRAEVVQFVNEFGTSGPWQEVVGAIDCPFTHARAREEGE